MPGPRVIAVVSTRSHEATRATEASVLLLAQLRLAARRELSMHMLGRHGLLSLEPELHLELFELVMKAQQLGV